MNTEHVASRHNISITDIIKRDHSPLKAVVTPFVFQSRDLLR